MDIAKAFSKKYRKKNQTQKDESKYKMYDPELYKTRKSSSTGYRHISVKYEVTIPINMVTDHKRHSKVFRTLQEAINFCEEMGIDYK